MNLDAMTPTELSRIGNDPKQSGSVRAYACLRIKAHNLRLGGHIDRALEVERRLQIMYSKLPQESRW